MSQEDAAGASGADPVLEAKRLILDAAGPHIPFEGWSMATVDAAAREAGVDAHLAKIAFPRGGIDLALFHHAEGDRLMAERLRASPLAAMRVRDRVALGVRGRLEIAEESREAVRKAAALFALPIHAPDGARAVWGTADALWEALGDPSDDLNWYTKRAILSSVLSATTLYWLGDESDGRQATWAFLDRRIDGVMRFEKFKAAVNDNPLGKMMMAGPNWLASQIKKPGGARETGAPSDLPG